MAASIYLPRKGMLPTGCSFVFPLTSRLLTFIVALIAGGGITMLCEQFRDIADWRVWAAGVLSAFVFGVPSARAGDVPFRDLPVCSATHISPEIAGICTVTTEGKDNHHRIKISLTAQNDTQITVAGYRVATEHYNDSYLTPLVVAVPGDVVAAHLKNKLGPRREDNMDHGGNPTNLHWFHGGVVTPRNNRHDNIDAAPGTGDNVYSRVPKGEDHDFWVPIPVSLDARVLEAKGPGVSTIPYPRGLNWWHSHLHGLSAGQVMGGLSGLLSIGEDKDNVEAGCKGPTGQPVCSNQEEDTKTLRDRTDPKYILLRDMRVTGISNSPDQVCQDRDPKKCAQEHLANNATAEWTPADAENQEFKDCGVWRVSGSEKKGFDPNPDLRQGYCQFDGDANNSNAAWLFTLNGQRYPTIQVKDGRNLLLRLGNVSANFPYWLELVPDGRPDDPPKPLNILSVDGVVPSAVAPASEEHIPVVAQAFNDFLLMPASRVELYIRNDEDKHPKEQVYILRTKHYAIGPDVGPEIELARIVLMPNKVASEIPIALNTPRSTPVLAIKAAPLLPVREEDFLPDGCVRDLRPGLREYRRVTFAGITRPNPLPPHWHGAEWSIKTEIIQPLAGEPQNEKDQRPEDPNSTTVGIKLEAPGKYKGIPFEDYEQIDKGHGVVNWTSREKRHVCIFISNDPEHPNSHKQLWVLYNATDRLHNFHIHQMKFRLATLAELDAHGIIPPGPARQCAAEIDAGDECPAPEFEMYDDGRDTKLDPRIKHWHDTIPIPPNRKVFIVMSFDAKEQLGRFVYHCHILKHEDKGLMAPIEVWSPSTVASVR